MGDTDSRTRSASPQMAGEKAPATHDEKTVKTEKPEKPGRATGQDQLKLPVMEPGKPADEGADEDEKGLLAGHNRDTRHLKFYGENIPVVRNPNTVKVYKKLQKTFGGVDEAVREQQELLGLSKYEPGDTKLEDIIKKEED